MRLTGIFSYASEVLIKYVRQINGCILHKIISTLVRFTSFLDGKTWTKMYGNMRKSHCFISATVWIWFQLDKWMAINQISYWNQSEMCNGLDCYISQFVFPLFSWFSACFLILFKTFLHFLWLYRNWSWFLFDFFRKCLNLILQKDLFQCYTQVTDYYFMQIV